MLNLRRSNYPRPKLFGQPILDFALNGSLLYAISLSCLIDDSLSGRNGVRFKRWDRFRGERRRGSAVDGQFHVDVVLRQVLQMIGAKLWMEFSLKYFCIF